MRHLKKFLKWSIVFLAVFTIVGFFGLPPLLKSLLVRTLSENLHREVAIKKINFNPYTLSLTVNGCSIKDRSTAGTFFSIDELFIDIQSLSALKRALILKEIRVTKPFINLIRRPDLSYNFTDLIENKGSKVQEKSKPLRFAFNNIKIVNGSIDFWDGPKQTRHTVRNLNITIPFISNIGHYIDTFVQPAFSAKINETPYILKGETKPFADSHETTFDVIINDLNIPYYLAYVPLKMNFKILSGYVDAKTKVSFVQYRDRKPSLTVTGDVAFKKIVADDESNNPLLRLPLLNLALATTEPIAQKIHLSKVSLQSPELYIRRHKTGTTNIESLFPKEKEAKIAAAKEENPAPVSIDIDEIQIAEGKFSFYDFQSSQPVTLVAENLDLKGENISTAKNSKGKLSLSFRLNKKGIISTSGTIGIAPVSANLKIDLKDIGIGLLQPYFTDKVKITVTDGSISTIGDLTLGYSKEKGMDATYSGKASMSNFSSIDKLNADDFLKWKSLSLSDIGVGYNPTYINIKGVALADFYARLIINPDGTLNLQEILEKNGSKREATSSNQKKEEVASPPDDREPLNIKVDHITLQGGGIECSDRSFKPGYSAKLTEIGGRISGLSSEEATLADVELRGKLNDYAPIEIMGKINPLKEDLFVDLKARFKDMDLSGVTPYSGKYIGYTIQKGQLSFELSYLIVKRKLDSQNQVFIDQLTLGDRVESPDATKLPVKLAIALLKDRKGEIKLDIPVSGYIDDPQFSVGKIILKILTNLIEKAATAPFALLGAVFGGGEELSYVEFDYGILTLTEPNIKKLDTLIKALYDRPSLKLDIEGHVDIEKDREGLKQYLFNRKLKAQKLNEMVKKGLPAPSVDELEIDSQEYEKYLKMAYKAEKFSKPQNVLGFVKDLPSSEMEKLMLTNTVVQDENLRLLASQRAMKVRDTILKSEQVDPERVFIIEPSILSPEKKETVKDSRVDLRLK
jgi:hypothetical protein